MWINCPLNCLAIPGVLLKLQKGWPEANNVSTMGKGNEVIFRTPAQLLLTLTRGMGTTVGISSGSARGLWLTFVAPTYVSLAHRPSCTFLTTRDPRAKSRCWYLKRRDQGGNLRC